MSTPAGFTSNMPDPHDVDETLLIDIKNTTDRILHCDNNFCPDAHDTYLDLIFLSMQELFPALSQDVTQCLEERSQSECTPLVIEAFNRVGPTVNKRLDQLRQEKSDDPLKNYDLTRYDTPFWFEGAGEIWRRVTHGSNRVGIRDCTKVHEQAQRCLKDPSKTDSECFTLYGHSLMCEPGVHCPYLRFPMLRCMGDPAAPNFEALKNCVQTAPNYQRCTREFVPQDPV